jgi:hypothetical protein
VVRALAGSFTVPLMAERRLTQTEQRLLDTIYDSFRASGVFPIYQWIDSELDASGIDAEATLQGLPPGLVLVPSVGGGVLSPEGEVRLYMRGLRECSDAQQDLDRFLELLRYLVRREQEWRPPSPTEHAPLQVTSDEVRRDLGLDDVELAKAWWFLRTEPGLASGGGGNATEWSFQITSSIRRFRDVNDIDDYLARQPPAEARPGGQRVSATAGMPIESLGSSQVEADLTVERAGRDEGRATESASVSRKEDDETSTAPSDSQSAEVYEDSATVVGKAEVSIAEAIEEAAQIEPQVAADERELRVTGEFAVAARALSDLASDVDYLGFEPLVDGLHALLDEPRTELPLTIAVTGRWGVGKSSLMRQLRTRLADGDGRRNWHVIEFDAWKYEKSERLWAALTKAIYEQPQRGTSWLKRFLFRSRLEAERQGWLHFLTRLLGPPALLIAGLAFVLVDRFHHQGWSITGVAVTVIGALGALASRRELLVLVGDPFRRAIDAYTIRRRFERELGFTSEADRDVEALTTLLTRKKETALAVFVDDLDRCSTAHIVEVVEAINQIFNASRKRECVFVLGMDVDVVAASIAAAYADTVRQLGGTDGGDVAHQFGLSYLAKIVQLTVAVPLATERQMQDLLRRVTHGLAPAPAPDERLVEQYEAEIGAAGALAPEQVTEQAEALREEAASEKEREAIAEAERRRREQALADSPLVTEAELEVVRFLDPNPRRLKQFDNAYRLQLYVANRTPVAELRFDLDQLVALAKWIVLRLAWPDIARAIDADPDLLVRLEESANRPLDEVDKGAEPGETEARDAERGAREEALEQWLQDRRLRALLRETREERRLAQLPLASFLHIL